MSPAPFEPQSPQPIPPPRHPGVGFPFLHAVLLLAAFLPAAALPGQELRLTDLFGEEQIEPAEPEERLAALPSTGEEYDAAQLDAYLHVLDSLAAEGQWEELRDGTELLIPWMELETPGFDEVLWQRARSFDGLGNREALLELTRLYLANFPAGTRRGWFLLRAGRISQERGNHADAEQLWRTIAEEQAALDPEEAIEGARYLLRRGGPRAARLLLAGVAIDGELATPEVQRDAIELFLESLLILDNPDRPVPGGELPLEPETVRLHVRRAALFAIRGDTEAAEELASMLVAGWTRRMVAPERELCEEILRGPGQGYWPPNRSSRGEGGAPVETGREPARPTTESTTQP